ncbi:MAG: NRDE family protein, partial [Cyclobacteriaceae bacterium]|nr:NRDE family protein [Cyclobacteriaceae bacterium]
MCLILLSYKTHPRYKLIIGANRDEFYSRPSEPARFWKEFPHLLAGKDLLAGGTWLGMTKTGKIGMITNYREIKSLMSDAPSRGHLLMDYFTGDTQAEDYLDSLSP